MFLVLGNSPDSSFELLAVLCELSHLPAMDSCECWRSFVSRVNTIPGCRQWEVRL